MDGKKVIFFIVVLCIVLAVLTWIFGQKFIDKQNLNKIETEIVN